MNAAAEIATRRPLLLRVPIARVTAGTADLRGEPRADAELVDEVRFGERLTLLARRGRWRFVQAREDHYFGWARARDLAETDEVPEGRVVAVALATLRASPHAEAAAVGALGAGTWLPRAPRRSGFMRVRAAWVAEEDLAAAEDLPLRAPTAADLVACARAFLDVPYRWSGTTAAGLDCSGFVQLVHRLCGIVLARDADQQATQGRAVRRAAAGDLLFFGAPRVTHVAMAIGAGRMIHAAGGDVGRVLVQRATVRGTPVAIRRFLTPSPSTPR